MAECDDLLVEIGTEELPPGSLGKLAAAFAEHFGAELNDLNLVPPAGAIRVLSSPRRLALLVTALPGSQPDREEQRLGPAVAAAYDGDGNPTRAAQGFAASCGATVDELAEIETDKGKRLGFVRQIEGRPASELLVGAVERALSRLPIPKPMRWGDHDFQFVRPVHWIVMLLGADIVPGELFGQPIGRETRGHRFHHPDPITLTEPAAYVETMRAASVMVDPEERRETVRKSVTAAGIAAGGRAVIREALLEEVSNLVEWPIAVVGSFEQAFLEVPAEALISSMEGHQKFFPVVDGDGALLPRFVGVSNIDSTDIDEVARGYGRVIRPRLADARFFWNRDRAKPLEAHREALAAMVYQKQLGSIDDKAARVGTLAAAIAGALDHPGAAVARAAALAKCDLMTDMVGEFPELQGIMGRYCALEQGESEAVAWAIEEHYRPAHAGDDLPASPEGRILAVADRIDTLASIFAAGLRPTGNKDPYALRRAAMGVGRILIEGELDLDLDVLMGLALRPIAERIEGADAGRSEVVDFVLERLRAWYADQGVDTEIFNAVLAVRPTRLLDFDRRIRACRSFAGLDAAGALAAANKRIGNILRKQAESGPVDASPAALDEPAEQSLAAAVSAAEATVGPLLAAGSYGEALTRLAELRPAVDRFFDDILVMADDPAVRRARLDLLGRLKGLFDGIADISLLARAR